MGLTLASYPALTELTTRSGPTMAVSSVSRRLESSNELILRGLLSPYCAMLQPDMVGAGIPKISSSSLPPVTAPYTGFPPTVEPQHRSRNSIQPRVNAFTVGHSFCQTEGDFSTTSGLPIPSETGCISGHWIKL